VKTYDERDLAVEPEPIYAAFREALREMCGSLSDQFVDTFDYCLALKERQAHEIGAKQATNGKHCSAVAALVGALRRLNGTTNARKRAKKLQAERRAKIAPEVPAELVEPDWAATCENCGATPVLPMTGMCGPCTFGEAETAGGNW
jgi:hypothetical protein